MFSLVFSCNEDQGDPVYITNTGLLYHSDDCAYLGKSKIPVSLREAWDRGYKACGRCAAAAEEKNKGVYESNNRSTTAPEEKDIKDESNPSELRQCSGITKKGERCKRMTRQASGRCYQHD